MKKLRYLVFAVMITCFLALLAGCGKPALPKPQGLKVNEATLELTWRQVVGARRYTVSVNGEERDCRTNSYSLENLDAGEYQIRVKARANEENNRDSGWSERISFTRETEPGFTFSLRNRSEYDVTGLGSLEGDIVIPEVYRGKPVTGIGDKAFANKSAIRSVTLGKNIVRIGSMAFSNSSIERIVFSEGLTSIGASAFAHCRNLEGEIVLPAGVAELGSNAFNYCRKITGIKLSGALKTIPDFAFGDCNGLTELTIPNGVESIGTSAFTGCTAISSVTFGSNLQSIGENAFYGCTSITKAEFGGQLETIGTGAFANCTKLKEATIPDRTTSIGKSAFEGCKALDEVSLGRGIETIGESAFRDTAIWNNETGSFVYVGNWLVGNKNAALTRLMADRASVMSETEDYVREGTIGIASRAFARSAELIDINLPDCVQMIDDAAFYNCPKLYWVVLGSGVKTLGPNAFNSCGKLQAAILGTENFQTSDQLDYAESSLEKIGAYAFRNCLLLDTIKIPDTVQVIDSYAFQGSGMWNSARASDSYVVYADKWAVGFYQELNLGEQFAFALREDTVGISNYAFYNNRNFQIVTVPGTVEKIGRGAFYGNANLIGINLPDSLTEIPDYMFYNCSKLTLGALPASLEKIGRSSFYGCKLLGAQNGEDFKNITFRIPDGVTEIGDYAFYGCGENVTDENGEVVDYHGIDTLIIGDNVKKIGASAFANFVSLKNVTVGNGVTELGARAFYKCERLENVSLGRGITEIPERAFYGCAALKYIALPAAVTSIGNYAFYQCTSLEAVGFSKALVSIGDYAFYGAAFKNLYLPDTVRYIGQQAFRNCKQLTSVTLENIAELGAHAFYGCSELTVYTTAEELPDGWNARWNSSYRPVVWGVTLSEEGYVISFTKTQSGVSNLFERNTVSEPVRDGYTFAGWASTPNAAAGEFAADEIGNIRDGATVYAVWLEATEEEPSEE